MSCEERSRLGAEHRRVQFCRARGIDLPRGRLTGTPTPSVCSRPLFNARRNVGLEELKTSPANKLIIFQLGHLLRSLFVKCWKASPRLGEGRNSLAMLEEAGGH